MWVVVGTPKVEPTRVNFCVFQTTTPYNNLMDMVTFSSWVIGFDLYERWSTWGYPHAIIVSTWRAYVQRQDEDATPHTINLAHYGRWVDGCVEVIDRLWSEKCGYVLSNQRSVNEEKDDDDDMMRNG